MSRPEHRHDDDRTGNGIVNHRPEGTPDTDPEQDGERKQHADTAEVDGAEAASGTTAPGTDPEAERKAEPGGRDAGSDDGGGGGTLTELFGGGSGGSGGPGGPGGSDGSGGSGVPGGFGGEEMDEAALRRMLQGAVQGLEPSEGTLDHLYRAVPARRARRRQGVVGAAAAALLIGTAVPAFVHVANSDGSATANPAIAGHGEQAQGGSGEDAGADTDGGRTAGPEDRRSEGAEGESGNSAEPSEGADPGAESSGAAGLDDPPGVGIASTRTCDPEQLGVASAEAGAARADGTVYGTFRIANVSGDACSVTSNGTVSFQAAGAADPLKITVVQHTAGDPAAGLPDPSLEPGAVFLKPSMTYEVRFAWVPSDTCPTSGGSPSPTPTEGGGGGGEGTAGSDAGTADVAAQFGSADEGPADGSIAVTHTPEAGAPTAEAKISNACAGTIYRTGVLDAS
ncbi:hypothetical protein B046DRAFT_02241 [Streptomyces sp. LamerLS-316]|uniref:hypothetical protein n=1 Tax=unclassified Streptomyces TaxID=2593676 RepID=UPI000823AD88|nr:MULTISPECIES: hypothetical protein [unclassified Streptomyces]MYQ42040.1 hypothetical protein [Streptomyces sp. SID4921]SCK30014.1 hypothetical protein B046DRAFT_02241 [Streptomyces sp. LamerLS-316]